MGISRTRTRLQLLILTNYTPYRNSRSQSRDDSEMEWVPRERTRTPHTSEVISKYRTFRLDTFEATHVRRSRLQDRANLLPRWHWLAHFRWLELNTGQGSCLLSRYKNVHEETVRGLDCEHLDPIIRRGVVYILQTWNNAVKQRLQRIFVQTRKLSTILEPSSEGKDRSPKLCRLFNQTTVLLLVLFSGTLKQKLFLCLTVCYTWHFFIS
jgi:hypothetical protein